MLIGLLVALAAPGACPAAGCAPNPGGPHVARHGGSFGHFSPNVAVVFGPDPLSLIEVPYNHAWTTPFGGYTVYPGQPRPASSSCS